MADAVPAASPLFSDLARRLDRPSGRVNRMATVVLFAVERPFCESLWGA